MPTVLPVGSCVSDLAVLGDLLYYSSHDATGGGGAVAALPLAATEAEILAAGQTSPSSLVATESALAWVTPAGVVVAVRK